MLLLDQVVQGARVTVMRNRAGRDYAVPGPGAFADALRACSVRYVLDRAASRQCSALFRASGDIPKADDHLTRFPAERFWLETFSNEFEEVAAASQDGNRVGFLVRTDPGARAGRITCFGQSPKGAVEYLGCSVVFGFDGALPVQTGPRFRINTADMPRISELLECARIEIAASHRAVYESSPATLEGMLQLMAPGAWIAIPTLLSFSALLNTRAALVEERSKLVKLNAARQKQSRPELLEHVAVRLDLSRPVPTYASGAEHVGTRRTPRLHYVRGHQVYRGGKSFWRTSHLRGDGDRQLSRTVLVTASPKPSQDRSAPR